MAVGAPCSPCAPPGRSRKRMYCVRAACTTWAAVEYSTEASRRLGAPVDTDGALTTCSPWRQPRSRISSDRGRANWPRSSGGLSHFAPLLCGRPVPREFRLGGRRDASGTRALAIHSHLVDCCSVASAARCCPVRRPGAVGLGLARQVRVACIPFTLRYSPASTRWSSTSPADRATGDRHRLGRA